VCIDTAFGFKTGTWKATKLINIISINEYVILPLLDLEFLNKNIKGKGVYRKNLLGGGKICAKRQKTFLPPPPRTPWGLGKI